MKKKTGKSGRYFWALIILAAAALLLGFYQEQLVMAKAPEQEDIRKFISEYPFLHFCCAATVWSAISKKFLRRFRERAFNKHF